MQKLYLLLPPDKKQFKVGISRDPLARWKSIGQGYLLDESVYFDCPYDNAREIENFILNTFFEFKALREGGAVVSASEWLDISCYEEVLVSLKKHRRHFRFGEARRFYPAVELDLEHADVLMERILDDVQELHDRLLHSNGGRDEVLMFTFLANELSKREILGSLVQMAPFGREIFDENQPHERVDSLVRFLGDRYKYSSYGLTVR